MCSCLASFCFTDTSLLGNTSLRLRVGTLSLNYETAPIMNRSITLCAPRSVDALSLSATDRLSFSTCMAYLHTSLTITLVITVADINESPVFDVIRVNFSAPGVGTVNQTIGFPLSRIASDFDIHPPFNTLSYSLSSGCCDCFNSPVELPVAVNFATGQLVYSVSGPLNAWLNPLPVCVVVTDGGGLNATVDVSLRFTDVDMQLSVLPTVLNVTHYSFGTSTHNVSVNFYAGTHVSEVWSVASVSVPWLAAVRVTASVLSVTLNSLLLSLSQEARVGVVILRATGVGTHIDCQVVSSVTVAMWVNRRWNSDHIHHTGTVDQYSSCGDRARLHLTIVACWQQSLYVLLFCDYLVIISVGIPVNSIMLLQTQW